jgi:hypothetical protein
VEVCLRNSAWGYSLDVAGEVVGADSRQVREELEAVEGEGEDWGRVGEEVCGRMPV